MMRIGLTGATGFIGTHFCQLAQQRGHQLIRYSRRAGAGADTLQQPADAPWALPEPAIPLDALIHLAGEPVAGLWTAGKRQRIRDSRVAFTEQLVTHLSQWKDPPAHFLCASAVGYYGDRGDECLTESSAAGEGFLAEVCRQWETAAAAASGLWGARTVFLRTGLVLGLEGGALALMRRAFTLGGGGRLGSGNQWMPWIHLQDEVGLILHALEQADLTGPLNLTAPQPVINRDFTRSLAQAVHRPAFFHAPAPLLKLLLGDMAEEMLLSSQRVLPEAALASGYTFAYPSLDAALAQLLAH
jgi:uncharacterized protein (TIGR01777 family)